MYNIVTGNSQFSVNFNKIKKNEKHKLVREVCGYQGILA